MTQEKERKKFNLQKWLNIAFAVVALIFGYDKTTELAQPEPIPQSYNQPKLSPITPPQDTIPKEDPKFPVWEVYLTYAITADVEAPNGLPGGYKVTYLYEASKPIYIQSKYKPTEESVLYIPPALLVLPLDNIKLFFVDAKRYRKQPTLQ